MTTAPATERQVAYASRLIASRDTTGLTVPDPGTLDRRECSRLIDRLQRCPERIRNGATATAVREAVDLAAQAAHVLGHDLGDMSRRQMAARLQAGGPELIAETVAASRRTIEGIPTPRPEAVRAARRGAVTSLATPNGCQVGVYFLDDEEGGTVYRLRANRDRTRLYCERLDPVSRVWSYAPDARRRLMPRDRMTAAQAARFGRMTGVCAMCGRTLTDPESIAAGIGPVCATRIVA